MSSTNMITGLFLTIDQMDADKFSEFLTDDATFTFANGDPVSGKANVKDFVTGFFSAVDAISHKIDSIISEDGTTFVRGQVTYTRKDATSLNVPFATGLCFNGDKIYDYQVYVDASTLFQ